WMTGRFEALHTCTLPHAPPRMTNIGKYKEASMFPNLIQDVISTEGLVSTDRLADRLHITKQELATATGLSKDAVTKTARANSSSTQRRLRETVEIINRILPWAGSLTGAFAWYRSQPLPSLGDKTA